MLKQLSHPAVPCLENIKGFERLENLRKTEEENSIQWSQLMEKGDNKVRNSKQLNQSGSQGVYSKIMTDKTEEEREDKVD